jgi:hypothetical protein
MKYCPEVIQVEYHSSEMLGTGGSSDLGFFSDFRLVYT